MAATTEAMQPEEGHGEESGPLNLFHAEEPSPSLILPNESFLKAAISLKDQIVESSWKGEGIKNVVDPTAYTGLLGTAFVCLRSYEVTKNLPDLLLCSEIVDTCVIADHSSKRHVTFLCGAAGVYALGAIAANYQNDCQKRQQFLELFLQVAKEKALPVGPEEGGFGMSYDLFYGRAGFLWTALFINKYLGPGTVSNDILMPIVDAVLAGGRAGASDTPTCPLMYRWHGTRFWGAAHGLAGIIHVLLHFSLSDKDADDVKGTLRYMMRNRFLCSGNYPLSEGNPRDQLVQWSHGASGVAIALCKASQVFPDDRDFRDAAIEAGEVVWKRESLHKLGLYDGISGNAYAFLSLYRLTKERLYEERAKSLAEISYHNSTKLVHSVTCMTTHMLSLFSTDSLVWLASVSTLSQRIIQDFPDSKFSDRKILKQASVRCLLSRVIMKYDFASSVSLIRSIATLEIKKTTSSGPVCPISTQLVESNRKK